MNRFILAIVAGLSAPAAHAQMAMPELSMGWRSNATSSVELALEMERLYLTLYNFGNLVVREVTLETSPYAERVMRDEGLFFGPYFPETIDAMLCDLNPDFCSRSKVPAGDEALLNPTSHVGGFLPSPGRWRTRLGLRLNVPDYKFTTITTLERVPVDAGWTPKDVQITPEMDCSPWKVESCVDVIERYNPPLIRSQTSRTSAVVPQLQIETTIQLRADERSDLTKKLSQVTPRSVDIVNFVDPTVTFTGKWDPAAAPISANDLAIESLSENLQPIGIVKGNASVVPSDETFFDQQMDLFKLVHHPFGDLKPLPDGDLEPVDVAVIDAAFFKRHCDLPKLTMADGTIIGPLDETVVEVSADGAGEAPGGQGNGPGNAVGHGAGPIGPLFDCDKLDPLALDQTEHAAAVIGLIAAPANGKGMVGMNPEARMHVVPMVSPEDSPLAANELVDNVKVNIPQGVRVANISLGLQPFLGNRKRFEAAFDQNKETTLFVVAAGNEGQDLVDGDCPFLPACLNGLENVITVVGLNDDADNPDIWREAIGTGTNTNPSFEIGAPAVDVLSLADSDKFVALTGTSFAAPQVTAAASLVFAAAEWAYSGGPEIMASGGQIAPGIVKDRLRYTADYFAGLNGKLSDGRLNIERAIGVNVAQFKLFNGERIVGTITKAPTAISCFDPKDNETFPTFDKVRRLIHDERRQAHILFLYKRNANGQVFLFRDEACAIHTETSEVEVRSFKDGIPEIHRFAFEQIRDYTAPLFPN